MIPFEYSFHFLFHSPNTGWAGTRLRKFREHLVRAVVGSVTGMRCVGMLQKIRMKKASSKQHSRMMQCYLKLEVDEEVAEGW